MFFSNKYYIAKNYCSSKQKTTKIDLENSPFGENIKYPPAITVRLDNAYNNVACTRLACI